MIDELDKQLISLLSQDAHKPSEVLAQQLNISSSSVRRRTKRLIENGAIRIIAVPDPHRLGLPLRAVIAFDVAHDKMNYVLQILGKRPEIRWLSATSGRYDMMAIGWFPSSDALYEFIERVVGKIEGIRNAETFICLYKFVSFY